MKEAEVIALNSRKLWIVLLVLVVLIGFMLVKYVITSRKGEEEFKTISMEEATKIFEKSGDYVILDVRRADEYKEGHIPGAVNVSNENIRGVQPEELPDPQQEIYVYCRTGRRSKASCSKLVAMGYTHVTNIGGIVDWKGEIEKEDAKEESFYISPITDEIFARIEGKSYKEDCTLEREELRYLHVLHRDQKNKEHEGEMIVNRHIAKDVLEIMKRLYEEEYPIEKIRLVDEYDADDEASMEDNNSSSFNFRFISHTNKVSKHGLGLAVDINTLYNPYVKTVDGKRVVEPVTGEAYTNRNGEYPYKIEKGDLCYQLFTEKGFLWGGEFESCKDYQHFEVSDEQMNQWYPDN
ncbi:MAG: M15 family metallopeptidase [Lachnospiraceae bacterium]|nr:M15 family metallopeptidase [Lachnospiraceae bacterium]